MSKVVLVDGNNLLYRSYYATAYNGNLMQNSKGFPTNALYGFVNMLQKIIDEENPTYMMVAFDKGKTFRHEKYTEYKGTRSETPNELIMQFPLSRKLCETMGIKSLEIDNYEADDIIGTFSKHLPKEDDVLIVSSDKDLLQLITDNVKMKLLKTHDFIMMDKEEFQKTYGVLPKRMIDLKALMGDASDNIPGVRGIGEKTAIKLLTEYENLDNLYANIDKINGKNKEKLLEDKDNAYSSYELATIYCDVPINTDKEEIKVLGIDSLKYTEILKELEFFSLLKKINVKEEKKLNDNKYTIVNNLDEINLSNEYSIYLEVLGYNYHDAKALGVSISYIDNQNYYIPIDLLRDSTIFNDGIMKYTYDLKKLLVVFDKYNIKIDKNIHDLMIEGYLLNKNIKNDVSYLANQYGIEIPFYDKEFGTEITLHEESLEVVSKNAILKSRFIYDFRNKFIEELDKEEMLKLYLEIELPLVYVLANMEITGFKIDKNYLLEMQEEMSNKIKKLEEDIYRISGENFNISSPKQLGDILFNKLEIPYPKKLKSNQTYSTSKDILDKLKGKYEIIDKILEYRTYSKLQSNYIIGLIDEIKEDGRIHTIYNQTLTKTGRLSSERPNLQNIPIRLEEGRKIRQAFIPDNNSIIISSDYSQIELRVFAHMSHAENMINAFLSDVDIHAKTASDIFHVPLSKVDKNMRRSAKAVNFGILYGISSFGLSEDLGINLSDANKFINDYLKTFPGIKEYMEKTIKEAYQNGYVKTLFNRKRVIEELKNKNYLIRSSGERMALNTPVQGTAADIIKKAMIEIQNEMDRLSLNSKMLVQIHDELVFTVLKDEVEVMTKIIKNVMENVYKFSVPLKVDIEYGNNWYEAK